MEATTTTAPTAFADCAVCAGSGWDEAFASPCNCPVVNGTGYRSGILRASGQDDVAPVRSQGGTGSSAARPVNAPTDKQVAFVARLLAERDASDPAVATCAAVIEAGKMDRATASKIIDCLLGIAPAARTAAPRTERPAPAADAPVGLHLSPSGAVVKVYLTRNDRKAGKVLEGHSWQYVSGATRGLSDATLMTAEQAKAYARTTGCCVNCGKEIGAGDTAETLRSLAAGYGPNCASRHGWTFPSVKDAVAILQAEGITHPLLVTL